MADQSLTFPLPANITPEKFFEEILPLGFEAAASADPAAADAQLLLQFCINGKGGGEWQAAIQDGRLSCARGSIDAHVRFTLGIDDWRDAVTGRNGAGLPFLLPPPRPGRPDPSSRLREMKGTMALELGREEKDPFKVEVCFNGSDAPRTVLRMKLQEFADIQAGKVNPQQAFMEGRVRVEGDMGLLMQVAMMAV